MIKGGVSLAFIPFGGRFDLPILAVSKEGNKILHNVVKGAVEKGENHLQGESYIANSIVYSIKEGNLSKLAELINYGKLSASEGLETLQENRRLSAFNKTGNVKIESDESWKDKNCAQYLVNPTIDRHVTAITCP